MARADGALLVVRAGKTKYGVLDKLLEQIPKDRLMGVVLNRSEEQPDSSSYYYQHRYYSRDRHLSEPNQVIQEKEEEVAVV
jgi:Mrp family chromosome partitioning ATPase